MKKNFWEREKEESNCEANVNSQQFKHFSTTLKLWFFFLRMKIVRGFQIWILLRVFKWFEFFRSSNFSPLPSNFRPWRPVSSKRGPFSSSFRFLSSKWRPLSSNFRPLSSKFRFLSSKWRPLSSDLKPLSKIVRSFSSIFSPLSSDTWPLANFSPSSSKMSFFVKKSWIFWRKLGLLSIVFSRLSKNLPFMAFIAPFWKIYFLGETNRKILKHQFLQKIQTRNDPFCSQWDAYRTIHLAFI